MLEAQDMFTPAPDFATTVGCRTLDVFDTEGGVRVPTWVLYPAHAPESLEHFGPYPLSVASNVPIVGSQLPLVVISHGTGGFPFTHRDLAAQLCRAGFVVALPEHTGNSRTDNSAAHTAANLANRPRQIRRLLDAIFADPELSPRLLPGEVFMIGHSIGAYTALALAGGRPTCFPHESPDGQPQPVPVLADRRLRALVLLAPATPWFMRQGALSEVDLPILMYTGARDELAPADFHGAIVLLGVRNPARVRHRVVENAGHFSFQSPFPPEMVRPDFAPSQDPPGIDRAALQGVLADEIIAFLKEQRQATR